MLLFTCVFPSVFVHLFYFPKIQYRRVFRSSLLQTVSRSRCTTPALGSGMLFYLCVLFTTTPCEVAGRAPWLQIVGPEAHKKKLHSDTKGTTVPMLGMIVRGYGRSAGVKWQAAILHHQHRHKSMMNYYLEHAWLAQLQEAR